MFQRNKNSDNTSHIGNICHEQRCKVIKIQRFESKILNKDNISQLNGVYLRMQVWFNIWNPISALHHTNNLGSEKHIIITIDA